MASGRGTRRTAARRPPDGVRRRRTAREAKPGPELPHDRYLKLGRDRAQREWLRYEGTAQRDLFRQLRVRFLRRHAPETGWALDVGAGPGRFSRSIVGAGGRPVALDLSLEMLRVGRELEAATLRDREAALERVCGDALRPPFPDGRFAAVAVLGNALGFEAQQGEPLLDRLEPLVAPGGRLLLEIAPGPGERSRYLGRLPAGAVRRLLAAPMAVVLPRVRREGFGRDPDRHRPASFRRWTPAELTGRWRGTGWTVLETLAVAPALGADAGRLQGVSSDPHAWERLLDLEERLGRDAARWPNAAAVLLAARRP